MIVTRGTGLRTNQGVGIPTTPTDIVDVLTSTTPASTEEWWSPHRWSNDSRERGTTWLGASAVVVDLDLKGPPDEVGKRAKVPVDPWADDILAAWDNGYIPGSLLHLTPHGVRVVFILGTECDDPGVYTLAVRGATHECAEVVAALVDVDVDQDVAAMADRKRLIWMPCTTDEKGKERNADVRVREGDDDPDEPPTFAVADLAASAPAVLPPPPPPPPPGTPHDAERVAEFDVAAELFNAKVSPVRIVGHEYADAPNRACPVCSHSQCFGPLMEGTTPVAGSWVCYSSNHVTDAPHGVEVGRAFTTGDGGTGWKGDTLDLACWKSGEHPATVLVNAGYLKPTVAPPPPPSEAGLAPVFLPKPDPMHVPVVDFLDASFSACPPGTFYRFSGEVGVLRRTDARLGHAPLRATAMALELGRHAEARTHVARKEGAQEVRTNFGKTHGQYLLDGGVTHEAVREIRGVYTSPVVAGDFNEMRPGYNEDTGLFYDEPADLAGLKPDITCAASVCRDILDGVLVDFEPVLTPANIANVVGLMVTALVRPSLVGHPVPLHFANASMEGSGKSILCEHFIGTLVTGREADNFHVADSSDENAKAVLSYARGGRFLIVFDNIPGGATMNEAHLASTITRPTIVGRRLGHTEAIQLPNRFVPMGTGNNVTFSPELARRVVPINFEPTEGTNVYTRTYVHADFRKHIDASRVLVLNTLLGAVERWKVAGRPAHTSGRVLPGFERWSATVGGIVDLLGYPEWLDGVDEWRSTTGNPIVEAMRSFCAAWHASPMGYSGTCKAKELFSLIEDDPGALGVNAGASPHQTLTRFGYKLREMVGRTDLYPYRVHAAGMRAGSRTYRLSKATNEEE